MTSFRRFVTAVVLGLGISGTAAATPASTDYSDIWWNAGENGWGINIVQQGATLFATLFVYGADNTQRWYVASNMSSLPAGAGQVRFGGPLFQTTGTFFGTVPYNPQQFGALEVGAMSVTFDTFSTGTLVYNVGPATVTKQITRQTLTTNNLAGRYYGALATTQNGCTNANVNGQPAYFIPSESFTVTLAGNAMTARFNGVSGVLITCNFAGTYSQHGRLGRISAGQWSCISPTAVLSSGTFEMTEVDVQVNHLSANFTGADNFCTSYVGRFGGIRDVVQ
jgi:hypothetical protein